MPHESKKEAQKTLIENMRRWQKIENAAVAQTARIIEATDNPIIRFVAETIQRDSNNHYRVQELVVDTLTSTTTVSVDDLAKVWDSIEEHIKIEKKTIELAEESLAALDHDRQGVQKYLLTYLLEDERKHDKMLADLELIKKGMYP